MAVNDFKWTAQIQVTVTHKEINIAHFKGAKSTTLTIPIPYPNKIWDKLRYKVGYAIVPPMRLGDWTNIRVVARDGKIKLNASAPSLAPYRTTSDKMWADDIAWNEK